MALFTDHIDTPLGIMEIIATESAVTSMLFVDQVGKPSPNAITAKARQQLLEYFSGEREQFDLPMQPEGTEFQQQVWRALSTIPFGDTWSYLDIANKIGNPKAVRAVGAANGKNLMTIVVPCHRVIGSNGSLTGYASGTERKAWLLNHESPGLF